MLFISCHPHYQLTGIIPEEIEYHPTNGRPIRVEASTDAEFFHGGAPNWAIEQALEHEPFVRLWHGLPEAQERRAMVSSFDTDNQGWSDKKREEVEEFMLNYADYGVRYIRAVSPEETMSEPWPNYAGTSWQQVPFVAKEIGIDLAYVLAYEQLHLKRTGLVARLTKLIDETPEPVADPESDPLVAA